MKPGEPRASSFALEIATVRLSLVGTQRAVVYSTGVVSREPPWKAVQLRTPDVPRCSWVGRGTRTGVSPAGECGTCSRGSVDLSSVRGLFGGVQTLRRDQGRARSIARESGASKKLVDLHRAAVWTACRSRVHGTPWSVGVARSHVRTWVGASHRPPFEAGGVLERGHHRSPSHSGCRDRGSGPRRRGRHAASDRGLAPFWDLGLDSIACNGLTGDRADERAIGPSPSAVAPGRGWSLYPDADGSLRQLGRRRR